MLGANVNQHRVQLGVCWIFWIILWPNVFENRPTGFSAGVNYLVRAARTLAPGIGTLALHSYVVAQHVLHEPVVVGSIHGNAPGPN